MPWLRGSVRNPLPAGECWQRTTKQLESDWGGLKRCRHRMDGRVKLTRDFQTLPEEYLLILNLENETYPNPSSASTIRRNRFSTRRWPLD
jgi:hypothetical protein